MKLPFTTNNKSDLAIRFQPSIPPALPLTGERVISPPGHSASP
jgi:hypothetical protein